MAASKKGKPSMSGNFYKQAKKMSPVTDKNGTPKPQTSGAPPFKKKGSGK